MKGIQIEKEELRLSLFTGDKNIYAENTKTQKHCCCFKSSEPELPARLHGGHRVITKSTAFLFGIGEAQWMELQKHTATYSSRSHSKTSVAMDKCLTEAIKGKQGCFSSWFEKFHSRNCYRYSSHCLLVPSLLALTGFSLIHFLDSHFP